MSERLDWHWAETFPLLKQGESVLDGHRAKAGEEHGRRLSRNKHGDNTGNDQAYYDGGRVEQHR
jgi:hypothetical protein